MATQGLVDLRAIEAAREVIAGRVHRTPLLSSTAAAAVTARATGFRPGDDRLYLKAEHLQKTGSFKPRGMTNRIAALTAAERAARGHHALGRATPGRRTRGPARAAGVPVTVVMPAGAVRSKVDACRGLRRPGRPARRARRRDLRARWSGSATRRASTFVPPVRRPGRDRRPRVRRAWRSWRTCPTWTWSVVGVGGGGLISGVAAALKERRPGVRVYGVEPERLGCPDPGARGADESVPIQPASVADGLGAPFAGELDAGDGPALRRRHRPASTTRRSWPGCGSPSSG